MRPTRALLVQAAQMTGYPVKAAWSSHNKGRMGDVYGVVEHHTGTYVNYQRLDDYPTLRVVRDGRAGLENSLSAYGLGRAGTIYCISEKLSWHAGNAYWNGTSDINGHYLGIEAESDGTYWSDAQEDAYPRLVAAILHVFGRGPGDHPRHAEVARPKGRKSDWAGLDDADFDRRVRGYLANPASINRNYQAAPSKVSTSGNQEDDVTDEQLEAALERVLTKTGPTSVQDILARRNAAVAGASGIARGVDVRAAAAQVQAAVAAVKADTTVQGDDEANILAKLDEVAALLPTPDPTPEV